ncbi:uncharacterized protein [Amphiura filiformis]|uniref:uncharacterized protein n=1 Tax=Amphiura filiformis TaxID=82378 RepID=UPI003B20EB73
MAGHLNALGLPAHLDEQAELEEELEDITSRLKRTLNRFDKEDEHEDDDNLEVDERVAFQARYESMTARMEAMAQERSALLSSLAEWLDTTDVESAETPSRPESRSTPSPSVESGHVDRAMFDSVVTTRMGVKKLKKLNENMVNQAVKGKDMEHMAKQESKLQKKVVNKFKLMMDARKRSVIGKTFGAHWKHASEEICALITRIRKEGVSGIDELEAQLDRASRGIQRQAEEMQRLEHKVHEKDMEIGRLTNENEKMSGEVELLTSEKERYRNQFIKKKKKLNQRQEEVLTPQAEQGAFSDGEEEELKRLITPTTPITTPYQPTQKRVYPKKQKRISSKAKKTSSATPGSSSEPPASEQERPPSPDRAGGSQFDEMWHIEEDNFKLKEKVLQLEKKVIEKEHKMLSLEHQIHELIESIKDSSPGLLGQLYDNMDQRGQSVQDIATAIRNEVQAMEETATKVTAKKGRKKKPTKGSTKQTTKKTDMRPNKVESTSPTPDTSPASSPSSAPQEVETEFNSELVQQLRKDKEILTQELQNSKSELRRAQWELLSLRQDSSHRGVVPSFLTTTHEIQASKMAETSKPKTGTVASGHVGQDTPKSSMMGMLLESHGRETHDPNDEESDRTAKALANIRMQDYLPPVPGTSKEPSRVEYDDEFQAYADMIREERGKFKQRLYTRAKMTGVVRTDGRTSVASSSSTPAEYEEYSVEDQGMQTDPTMDPLGAWSNVPTIQMEKRIQGSKKSVDKVIQAKTGPLPPKEWALFDPTALQDIFEKKTGPKQIDSAADLIGFVDSELRRLTQGISGYTSYLNNLIEQEVSSMANTNAGLRKKISQATLKRIDKMRDLVSQGKDGGQKGDENKIQEPQIRRGRFEIAKPGKQSRYNTKRAFGSYLAGRRFMIQQGGIPEQLQTQQIKTPGQAYPWETYAKDHIYKAEIEAAERKEQEKRDAPKRPNEMLKRQVDQIAQHAINVLQGTTTFFKETLANQLEEFDALQGAVQLKEETRCISRNTGEHTKDDKQLEASLSGTKLSRSTSLGSFLEQKPEGSDYRDKHRGPVSVVGHRTGTPTDELFIPAQSQSLSSIQSSHRCLPPLLLYKEAEPRNRHQYKLPKATLPKKGMVTLAVTNLSKKSTQNEQDKAYDAKRRYRPAPQTHTKLQSKQKDILHKVVKEPEADDVMEDTNLMDLRNQALGLPVGFFGTLTQETDSMKTYEMPSQAQKQVTLNATEQLKDGTANVDKYAAVFSQTY